MPCTRSIAMPPFLSTPSARRATGAVLHHPLGGTISIHALREEGDERVGERGGAIAGFLSTPSARRATVSWSYMLFSHLFLSTPSARRATMVHDDYRLPSMISIHALREEGDMSQV